jgi:hypothetical protein
MSYLIYVAGFGAAVVFFLWLRDARIFLRTGLAEYRTAAYRGVVYGAIALLGVMVTLYSTLELLGLGIILAALYLQGRAKKPNIWTSETTLERFLGSVRIQKKKPSK